MRLAVCIQLDSHHRIDQAHFHHPRHPAQRIEMQFDTVSRDVRRVMRPQRETPRDAGQAQRADLDRGFHAMLPEIGAGEMRRELGARQPQQQRHRDKPKQNGSQPAAVQIRCSNTPGGG
jgi:hypothetical protein